MTVDKLLNQQFAACSGLPHDDESSHQLLQTWNYYSMAFQALGLWLHLKEVFFLGLGLTITEINVENKTCEKMEGWHTKSMHTK